MTLSDCPELFAQEAVIVIGEQTFNKSLTKNAAQKEGVEAIATNLGNMTGNKSGIIYAKK